ncbi:methyltransferase family protein [Microbacterium saperdae]|uniref:Methyltransferase family protein n=1 Tax=Microbacterium saperdae TaxID=69368 RepID=A0A543BAI8_9MICO|nr:methyltransferase [Microbacterium saperdae]TQL81816.1 methyltransferase family protein [Microbacterium saperdae]
MSDTPAPTPAPLLCAALAADLDAADLRSEPLRSLWGEEADDALARGMREPILRAIRGDDGVLATLGRLLVLGMPQPRSAVDTALPRLGVDGLVALGLATADDETVTPIALLRPQSFVDAEGVGEWWIASDLDEVALDGALPPDHVLGVGGASRTLAEIVVPIEVDRALDLGTGCGIQALLVARRAGTVVATDISARALAYAEMNALLNGVGNIEFRLGSMFEPVVGEAFDLIVSNPPFVITPRGDDVPEYEYRDGGLVGDALVELFVRTAPTYLTAGGIAQLLGNWESRDGVTGLARLEAWVPAELDLWVIEREQLSPLAYAELWIRDGGTTPRDRAFTPLLTAWLDDFAARGVTSIGFGYVLLRRGGGMPLRRTERLVQHVSGVGQALGTGLHGHDLLAEGVPATLLTAPDVTEARHLLPGNDDPSVIELRQGGGFARTVNVDPALAAFVGASDGELTVGQIAQALADLFDVPLPELWAELEPRIRSLVLDGFLVPAE